MVLPNTLVFICLFPVVFILAHLSYTYFESYFLRLKSKIECLQSPALFINSRQKFSNKFSFLEFRFFLEANGNEVTDLHKIARHAFSLIAISVKSIVSVV